MSQSHSAPRIVLGPAVGLVAYMTNFWMVRYLQRPAVVRWKENERRATETLSLIRFPGEISPPVDAFTGWLFYSAHNIGIEITLDRPGNVADSTGLINLQYSPIWAWYLAAIPLLGLFVSGLVLGWFVESSSTMDNAAIGAAITAGYLPLMIIGTFWTHWSYTLEPGTILTVQPPLSHSIVAGFLYPVILGGMGGIVGGGLKRKLGSDDPHGGTEK